MEKYIATWVYLDSPEEKSYYPNTGGTGMDSTSPEFQAVYWRCIVLFYESSLRFHKDMRHLFFTNTDSLPIVDGFTIENFFKENNIEVITLKNLYPLPENYFSSFRNQFFEFSIIDHLAGIMADNDMLILLDSDCVFSKSLNPAYETLAKSKSIASSYIVDQITEYEVHGLTGSGMRQLFGDLGVPLDENPYYLGGELLFAKGSFFKYVAKDFVTLYDNMLLRYKQKRPKFNEEAQVLSYYYYKHDTIIGGMDGYIKRIWTNRNYFRNVMPDDVEYTIWHLPNEKKAGIESLFNSIKSGVSLKIMEDKAYLELMQKSLLQASNHKRDYYKMLKSFTVKALRRLNIVDK